jgi:signal transduction histidine kinase
LKQRLHRRLAGAFAAIALGVSALFGLFALGLQYTIEQDFFDAMLSDEASRQQDHFAKHGRWVEPQNRIVELYVDRSSLPADLARVLASDPGRSEVEGDSGRHYKVRRLHGDEAAPWLVVEVSRQPATRPMRQLLQGWLLAWAAVMVGLSLAVGWWLARYISAPLELLARRVAQATPEQLPDSLARGLRDDEVGAVALRFDALIARTREFIAREQAFSRDASHELRTPLSVLHMALERMRAESELPQKARQQLGPMLAAVELMTQAVNTLLLLAREGDDLASTQVALLPLVERWVLAHAAWLDEQPLSLELDLSREDALCLPAPVLQIALSGLLGNAFAHGRSGGRVHVGFDAGSLKVCNPSSELPDDVGDEFVKGAASSGTGLGLSILRRLLQRHGAELRISHQHGLTCVSVSSMGKRPLPQGSGAA